MSPIGVYSRKKKESVNASSSPLTPEKRKKGRKERRKGIIFSSIVGIRCKWKDARDYTLGCEGKRKEKMVVVFKNREKGGKKKK